MACQASATYSSYIAYADLITADVAIDIANECGYPQGTVPLTPGARRTSASQPAVSAHLHQGTKALRSAGQRMSQQLVSRGHKSLVNFQRTAVPSPPKPLSVSMPAPSNAIRKALKHVVEAPAVSARAARAHGGMRWFQSSR